MKLAACLILRRVLYWHPLTVLMDRQLGLVASDTPLNASQEPKWATTWPEQAILGDNPLTDSPPCMCHPQTIHPVLHLISSCHAQYEIRSQKTWIQVLATVFPWK